MIRQLKLHPRACLLLAGLLVLAAVASCGGGVVGSGGTGSVAGVSVGTVNGFGSVIVDSVTYDDRSADVVHEVAPGVDAPSDVQLGHRVAVEYLTAGVANVVRVEATLAGPVASVGSGGKFSVLGQTVTVNAIGSAGPITQFGGGYSAASDVRAGDAVEIHGLLVRQSSAYVIQATRVDKLAAAPAYLRVTGLVSSLKSGAKVTFTLGALTVDATGATVLPVATALADGQIVTVLALPAALSAPSEGNLRLQAAQVRIRELIGSGSQDDYVSGSVSHLDTVAKTLTLGSVLVDYSAAVVTPATTPLANGQYVLAHGAIGATGTLVATSLTIRDTGSDTEAELKGNIRGTISAPASFIVRDVTVDARTATLQGCPAGGLVDGLYVQVSGSLGSSGVLARTIQCQGEPSGADIEREGVASAVNAGAMNFTLTPKSQPAVSVTWTSKTYFGNVTPTTLAGQKVNVEGTLSGGVLTAKKIKVED
jgi:hypothetical protein